MLSKKQRDKLIDLGQSFLLDHMSDLPESLQLEFEQQLLSLNLEFLSNFLGKPFECEKIFFDNIEAPKLSNIIDLTLKDLSVKEYKSLGEQALSEGKIALFTVAGGHGSRLGWNGPKGTYPASPIEGRSLFQLQAEQILAASSRFGKPISWYLMVSPENYNSTRLFLKNNRWFGVPKEQILIITQSDYPVIDSQTGKILLKKPGSLAFAPNGHGGVYEALSREGIFDQMRYKGIEHLSYSQIDNPLASLFDPAFIGAHLDKRNSSAEFSSKFVEKKNSSEKAGIFCNINSTLKVIEYSDLPQELSTECTKNGLLKFSHANIALHIIGIDFASQFSSKPLPIHFAKKSMPFYDLDLNKEVVPTFLNAIKMEHFIFDVLKDCKNPLLVKTLREEEFGPIKNKEGEDSPSSSRHMQSQKAAKWLAQKGANIPRDSSGNYLGLFEISSLTALYAEDVCLNNLTENFTSDSSISL